MTINEIIKKYHDKILMAKDKKTIVAEIIDEINGLVYSETNSPISDEDKKKILAGLQNELLNESLLIHSQDNKEHLELISQAIQMLGGK